MPSIVRSDIAILAGEAAIDIDNMLLGGAENLVTTRRLAMVLSDLIGYNAKTQAERPAIEPVTFLILNVAVTKAGVITITLRDLLGETERIIESLSDYRPYGDAHWADQLREMKAFCFALSKAILEECDNRHIL